MPFRTGHVTTQFPCSTTVCRFLVTRRINEHISLTRLTFLMYRSSPLMQIDASVFPLRQDKKRRNQSNLHCPDTWTGCPGIQFFSDSAPPLHRKSVRSFAQYSDRSRLRCSLRLVVMICLSRDCSPVRLKERVLR